MNSPDKIAPEYKEWCDERVKALAGEFKANLDVFNEPDFAKLPETLYHYTSEAGLRGILESKKIWATRMDFLNDESEFLYGAKYASFVMAERMTEIAGDKYRSRAEKLSVIAAGAFSDGLFHFKNPLPLYVACFSEKGNSLNQWRSYADLGSGYSIGISRKSDLYPDQGPHYLVNKVEYDREKQSIAVRRIVDIFINSINEYNETPERFSGVLPKTWSSHNANRTTGRDQGAIACERGPVPTGSRRPSATSGPTSMPG